MALTRPTLNQINTTITALNDPLTVINKSATTANQDVGFVFNRDGGSTANVAVIWDETNDQFALVTTSSSGATNANVTISDYADVRVGSAFVDDVLRIAQNASGLRMTNVGAFDNDGSDNFRIFATNDLILAANGESGTAITIDATNQDVAVSNDLTVSGELTVDTNTLHVSPTNNRVGIGTASPAYQVEIENTGSNALLVLDRTDGASTFIEGGATDSVLGSVGANDVKIAYNSVPVVTFGAGGAITTSGNVTAGNLRADNLTTQNAFAIVGSDNNLIQDTTLSVDPASNFLGINQTSPEVTLHMTGEGAQTAQIRMEQYNDSADAPDVRTRRYRGTVASPSAVQAGDYLFRSNHEYWNGTSLLIGGAFAFDNTNNANRTQFSVAVDIDGTGANPQGNNGQFKIDGNDSGAITFNNAYKFPTADGSANNILATDGSGALTFTGDPTFTTVTTTGDMTIGGNVVPSANVTYNLGSPTMWWNDLYLSGGTIFLGGLEIKDEAGEIKFKKRGENKNVKIAGVTESVTGVGQGNSNLSVHTDGIIRANVDQTNIFSITSDGVIPAVNSNGVTGFSLGSASYAWKDIYVSAGSLYVNGQKVLQEDSGTIVVSADEDQNINITTTGTGDVELNPGGSIQLKGNVVLTAGKTISQAGGAAAEFSAGVKADSVTSRTADTNLTLSGNGTGVVNVNDSLTVANDVTVTGNLTVNGATTTVSSTNTVIEDALLLLADGQSGSPTKDAGFVVERGSSTNVAWLWDESADEFVAITTSDDATTVGDVGITTYANVHASYFLGDGSQLTGLPETYGNTEVLAYLTDNSYATQTYVNTANTNMGGYVDNAVSTANVNLKGYTDGQLASYATTSALTTANTNVVGYVDGEVTTLNSTITTANTNVVGYVDNAVSTANVNLKGYADATFLTSFTETNDLTSAVTWANIPDANVPESAVTQHQAALSITESQISDLGTYATTSALTTANTNVVGYVDGEITTVNSTITTANTNVVGYVDNAVSTANVNLKGYVDAGNTNVVGYVDSAVTTANTNLKGYTDGQLASYATTSALTTANTNMQGYVDNEISSLVDSAPGTLDTLNEIAAALGDDPNLATTLTNTITTANTNMQGYVDGEITTVNSTITTANTNVVGYVDNAVSTANVNLKGYVDAGNTNVVGYVDNAVTTANTNLKGYADATFAQQTLTADLDGADTYGIINLVDPTSAQDAVTLAYLESALSSDVTNIISDDTSVTVTDDGVDPGYIELAVDGTTRANITSAGLTVTGNVSASYVLGDGSQLTNLPDAGNAFTTIAVSGQSDIVADSSSDTLTLIAGDGVVITTNAGSDALTIATSGSGDSVFLNDSDLGDFTTASASEDLGLVTTSATTSVDLGELVTSGLLYPGQLVLPKYATASLPNSSVSGQLAYDTDENAVKFTDGTQWTGYAGLASPNFTGTATFDTNVLYVDGTNNRVGINNNATDITGTSLDQLIVGSGSGNNGVVIDGGASGQSRYGFSEAGTIKGGIQYDGANNQIEFMVEGIATEVASIDSDGGFIQTKTDAVNAQTEGDYSTKRYVLHGVTTDDTETEIFVGGVASTRIPVPTDTTVTADAVFTARRTDATGHSAGFHLYAVADNFSGTTADVGNVYEVTIADDSGNLAVDLQADDTTDTIKVLVQGEASKTIRWMCVVTTVEVSQ